MMWTAVVVWAAIWAGSGMVSAQEDGSFWWLDKVTNKEATPAPEAPAALLANTTEEVYCECVPYYQCINGIITTSGVGLLDPRIGVSGGDSEAPPVTNVENCPNLIDVCCGLPPDDSITITTTEPPKPTLPPDTPCECVPFNSCTAEKLVSDGKGNVSLEILGIGGYWHSKCPQAFAVCCALDPTTPQPTTVPNPTVACECVPTYLCNENGYIITDGGGLLDIRTVVRPSSENICPQPFVCCLPPLDTNTNTTTPPPYTPPPTTTPTTTQAPVINCGTRNSMGVKARILGFRGGESQFGEFPWVTAILNTHSFMGKTVRNFVGGGSLIHPRVVLTAAHKIVGKNKDFLVARLGEWDTQDSLEPYPYQEIEVEQVIIHHQFDPNLLHYDVALLFLKEEARIQSHINTICVAPDLESVNINECVINGWGVNGFDEGSHYQKIMKSLTIPLVKKRECVNSLRTTRLGRYFNLHNSFLCAGGEKGKDACKGDGGGPLACPRKDDPSRYLLVGITAWGIGCGEDGIPGVYVNVPAHRDWIRAQTEAWIPLTTTTTSFPTTNATVYNAQVQSSDTTSRPSQGPGQEEREQGRQDGGNTEGGENVNENKRTKQEERRRVREERRRAREERRRLREERRNRRQG